MIDPIPKLINKTNGNLINDITLASSLHTGRVGTIADGTSKLLLMTSYKNPVNFSIADDANLSKGTLRSSFGYLKYPFLILSLKCCH